MRETARGEFEVKKWDEAPWAQIGDEGKLTKASVRGTMRGDITGEASTEWLMCYSSAKKATYSGYQQVTGTLGGKKGSFVVATDGTFDGTMARSTWRVVPGTGTGDLTGIRGEGSFEAPHGSIARYSLEYEIAGSPARA